MVEPWTISIAAGVFFYVPGLRDAGLALAFIVSIYAGLLTVLWPFLRTYGLPKDWVPSARAMLAMARALMSHPQLLLLDEPSNDLDVETLRALEDALLEFAGSVLVISHDRWFLDRIATHILAFEGNSQVTFFDGNYQEYEADKKKRLGEEGAKPKRIRYKPISR